MMWTLTITDDASAVSVIDTADSRHVTVPAAFSFESAYNEIARRADPVATDRFMTALPYLAAMDERVHDAPETIVHLRRRVVVLTVAVVLLIGTCIGLAVAHGTHVWAA